MIRGGTDIEREGGRRRERESMNMITRHHEMRQARPSSFLSGIVQKQYRCRCLSRPPLPQYLQCYEVARCVTAAMKLESGAGRIFICWGTLSLRHWYADGARLVVFGECDVVGECMAWVDGTWGEMMKTDFDFHPTPPLINFWSNEKESQFKKEFSITTVCRL